MMEQTPPTNPPSPKKTSRVSSGSSYTASDITVLEEAAVVDEGLARHARVRVVVVRRFPTFR